MQKVKNGKTTRHCVADRGHKEIAELLIENGVDVHAKIFYGGPTALHFAMEAEDLETIQLLIMYKADLNASDRHGRISFRIASKRLKDSLLAQSLMRLLQKKQGMILLTDLRLWLHIDYPIVGELQKLAEERKSLLCSTMQNKPLEVSSQTPALLLQEIPISNDEQEQTCFDEKYTRKSTGLALDGEGLKAVNIKIKLPSSFLKEWMTIKQRNFYCASNAQDDGQDSKHNVLSKKLNVSGVKYCRIIPENTEGDSFDSTDLLALYKEK